VGVSGLTIYGWEKGRNKPRNSCLEKLAAIRGLRQRTAHAKLELLNKS